MGVVYLAQDPLIDRQVAVKTLRVDVDAEVSDEFRERFFREARAAGRLNHPGIVTVHDVGEDPSTGVVFIAMEFVHGRNLKQLLQTGRSFRPSQAARLVAAVASALEYAHQMGVVHRDIKPANLLITDDGSVKITDFGVARLESSNLTVDGQFLGTPNYMSPEQVLGQPVDGRSDLFSLGVVLFELLTGRRPFTGSTLHEVTTQIVQQATPIPSSLNTRLPPSLNPILLKCLEKDRERRFGSCAELATVLTALARSLVARDPDDSEQTGVFTPPDLGTQVADDGPAPSIAVGTQERTPSSPSDQPPTLPIADDAATLDGGVPDPLVAEVEPAAETCVSFASEDASPTLASTPRRFQALHWTVQPRWVVMLIGIPILVLAATVGLLSSARDSGPFAAASDEAITALHQAALGLNAAHAALDDGDPVRAESLALGVLDQQPTSPAARRVVHLARQELEQQEHQASTEAKVANLVGEGRQLYRRGQYQEAVERFAQASTIDPEDEIAASFLELARERAARSSTSSRSRPTPAPQQVARPPAASPRATPATAELLISFESPISQGAVIIQVGSAPPETVSFSFTRRGMLGIRRAGTGRVRKTLVIPSGQQKVNVALRDEDGQVLGSDTFDRRIHGGSRWTLRIDLSSKSAQPLFYLVAVNS